MSDHEALADGTVLHRLENGISYVTLNRPEAGNALLQIQRPVIRGLLQAASDDCEVRGVVLGANGKHFCTGADLRAGAGRSDRPRRPGDVAHQLACGPESAQRLVAAILDCRKPVIAAVQGGAAGMGAQIALACDLVVASENAYFAQVFIRRGILIDAGGAYLLPRRIGLQKAKELVFFGDDLPAPEAMEIGLVNKVVPAGELASAVAHYAQRLAVAPTTAIGLAKQLLNRSLDGDRETALRDEAFAVEINSATDDMKEGIAAFVERRSPRFVGY